MELQKVYSAVLSKAPNAQLVVFTYPQLLTNTNRRSSPCYGDAGMQIDEIEWIRARNAQINTVVIDAAAAVSSIKTASKPIEVVKLGGALISEGPSSPTVVATGVFDGYQVCNEPEWINGVTIDHSDEAIIEAIGNAKIEALNSDRTYHPNAAVYQSMLSKLLDISE